MKELITDQRGAVYVEHLIMVSAGLVIAFGLKAAGTLFLTYFQGITNVLYSGVP